MTTDQGFAPVWSCHVSCSQRSTRNAPYLRASTMTATTKPYCDTSNSIKNRMAQQHMEAVDLLWSSSRRTLLPLEWFELKPPLANLMRRGCDIQIPSSAELVEASLPMLEAGQAGLLPRCARAIITGGTIRFPRHAGPYQSLSGMPLAEHPPNLKLPTV